MGEYYTEEELQIDPGVGAALSDDITLIYWDYYTLEEEKVPQKCSPAIRKINGSDRFRRRSMEMGRTLS